MKSQISFLEDADQANESALKSLEGFRYESVLINRVDEYSLLNRVRELPFREFDFHGFKGKRRVVSFGWQYDFAGGGLFRKADHIPDFLVALRSSAASFARVEPEELEHVLVTEYRPGAGIGWHRDRAVFGKVVGISLLSSCLLRFRRRTENSLRPRTRSNTWERVNVRAEPRSAYLLTGPARSEWQHSILRVDSLRYSITFRSLAER